MGHGPPGLGGDKPRARRLRDAKREELRAALHKRQVAAMEVPPELREVRDGILAGGPDVAPLSSYEELPASKHCYWADPLLLDHAQLQGRGGAAPPGSHAADMAAALVLHERAPRDGSVLVSGKLGDFAVDAEMAALLASL